MAETNNAKLSAYLEESAQAWEAAARHARFCAEMGISTPEVAAHKARTYERVAEALRLESSTGEPHCTCHLQPRHIHHGREMNVPHLSIY